jgi:hypothetical protein
MGRRVKDDGESEGRAVMAQKLRRSDTGYLHTALNITPRESEQTRLASITREQGQLMAEECR